MSTDDERTDDELAAFYDVPENRDPVGPGYRIVTCPRCGTRGLILATAPAWQCPLFDECPAEPDRR